jgi:hypothetical protein
MTEVSAQGWENVSGTSVAPERQERILRVSADQQYLLRLPHSTFQGVKEVKVPLEVHASIDAGRTWSMVPLRLDVRSYLRYASPFHRRRWPPELIFACGVVGQHLALRFLDIGIMFDLPYSSTSTNRETDWLARYLPDRRHWTLQPLDGRNPDSLDTHADG